MKNLYGKVVEKPFIERGEIKRTRRKEKERIVSSAKIDSYLEHHFHVTVLVKTIFHQLFSKVLVDTRTERI